MPSYLYAGNCYAAPSSVYAAMAAACPPVTSTGASLQCSSIANGYTIQIGGRAIVVVNPVLENCVPEVVDAATLGGLVVASLASAFALKILWRAF